MKNYNKFLDKVTKIVLIVYLVVFFFASVVIGFGFANFEREDNRTNLEMNDFNSKWNYSNGSSMVEKEIPLFDNGKTAVDYAYQKFSSTTTKQIEIIGPMVITAMGKRVDVNIHEIVIFYENGDVFVQQNIWEWGNAFGQTSSTERLYRNDGQVFIRRCKTTKDINYDDSTGKMTINWTDQKWREDRIDSFYLYNFSHSNITKEKTYEPIYNAYTGKVQSYKIGVELNPVTAVKGYDKQSQIESTLETLPKWSMLDFQCTLDKNGKLVEAFVRERYSAKKKIPVFGNVDYTSYNEYKLTFTFDPENFALQPPEVIIEQK